MEENERSLAALRRCYERVSGERVSPSSFYERFGPSLVRFLRRAFEHALAQVPGKAPALQEVVAGFRDIYLVDSTVIRLRDFLARSFPACRTNHTQAAAKVHMVMSVEGLSPARIKVTPERVHDRRVLRVGPWVAGKLLLFDLGYFCYALLARIVAEEGFFVTRLKDNANPEIVRTLRSHRGRKVALVGCRLRDVQQRLRRRVLDVEVEIHFRKRAYRGSRRGSSMKLRLVGIWDETRRDYHFYLTNVPSEILSAEEVGRLYGLRWQVELLFREMKSSYRLEQIPSGRKDVALALLYATLLTLMASRALFSAVHARLARSRRVLPPERWGRLLVACSRELLVIVLDRPVHARHVARKIAPFLLREAPDPNRARDLVANRSLRKAA
jgi:putative transposase